MLFLIMKKILPILLVFLFTYSYSEEYKSKFDVELFKSAQNSGKVVIIHSWNKFCTTCAKQKKILEQAKKDFQDHVFMSFEQTKEKDIAKFLSIDYWTTVVVYKNNREVARELGIYKKEKIYSLIKKGI